jgi:hypothetical protein
VCVNLRNEAKDYVTYVKKNDGLKAVMADFLFCQVDGLILRFWKVINPKKFGNYHG